MEGVRASCPTVSTAGLGKIEKGKLTDHLLRTQRLREKSCQLPTHSKRGRDREHLKGKRAAWQATPPFYWVSQVAAHKWREGWVRKLGRSEANNRGVAAARREGAAARKKVLAKARFICCMWPCLIF